jgi:hypothetical protein
MNILRLYVAFTSLQATFGILEYCGQKECRFSSPTSCEDLKRDYHFQGSCCSLKYVPATRGCLIVVGGDNNCAWTPKCGICSSEESVAAGACLEYRSESKVVGFSCNAIDEYDVLNEVMDATLSPADAPTCPPTQEPTTLAESLPEDSAEIVIQGYKCMILGALAAFFLL